MDDSNESGNIYASFGVTGVPDWLDQQKPMFLEGISARGVTISIFKIIPGKLAFLASGIPDRLVFAAHLPAPNPNSAGWFTVHLAWHKGQVNIRIGGETIHEEFEHPKATAKDSPGE